MYNYRCIANLILLRDSLDGASSGVSNLKLQKLMYYMQGCFLAVFEKPLFDAEFEAWTHGPVISEMYHLYKNHGSNAIPPEPTDVSLTEDELSLFNEVFDSFACYSAWKLRDMTHVEKPWLDHEFDAGAIPNEEIKQYFKENWVNG